jgi:hypothetical protein
MIARTLKRLCSGPRHAKRRGTSVVDVLVGITVLSVGLLGVAGMTAAAARKATTLATQSGRDGIALQEMNKLASLPYDTLGTRTGCTTATSGTLTYTRCISVTDITVGEQVYKRVRIILTPSGSWGKADTVYVNRARGAITNPLGS